MKQTKMHSHTQQDIMLQNPDSSYRLLSDGSYLIRDYNRSKEFSGFLPAIAGKDGKPLWAFYVNRGQGMAAFGTGPKENAILEFMPANKSYENVQRYGFRTFAFVETEGGRKLLEPFQYRGTAPFQEMIIRPWEIEIADEIDGLSFRAVYGTLPHHGIPAMLRTLVVTNTGKEKRAGFIADGIPRVIPAGIVNTIVKVMGTTAQAWAGVEQLDTGIPLFKVSASLDDSTKVELYRRAHTACAMVKGDTDLCPVIVDSKLVFGEDTSLSIPQFLLDNGYEAAIRAGQVTLNQYPCAFFLRKFELLPGQILELNSAFAALDDISAAPQVAGLVSHDTVERSRVANAKLYADLTRQVETVSAHPVFDQYVRYNFMDNVLRGGVPEVIQSRKNKAVIYLYSRKHGDLERDYNAFTINPSYYSSGPGNYRDVNQNRRSDVWFEPELEDWNLKEFMNLLQMDGYNPLVVEGRLYHVPPAKAEKLASMVQLPPSVMALLRKPVDPGILYEALVTQATALSHDVPRTFAEILLAGDAPVRAVHGEGFWIDHWTYNLDLVDSLFELYPDRVEQLTFDRGGYTYFDDTHRILPRSEKYGVEQGKVRQHRAVVRDERKIKMIEKRLQQPNAMRVGNGRGKIYQTNLYEKLLSLALVKTASLDQGLLGLEMEANKPGWYDALNGLPGILGSSTSELVEVLRLWKLLDRLSRFNRTLLIPREIVSFMEEIVTAITKGGSELEVWDRLASAREAFRAATFYGISGVCNDFGTEDILGRVKVCKDFIALRVDAAIESGGGLLPTYFRTDILEWEEESTPIQRIVPLRVRRAALPLFLEGIVKQMKVCGDREAARDLYRRVKQSQLFDAALNMYRVNESLKDEPPELGRCKAFPPGWLENESIWMHMQYKYLLEVLKAGLHEEFWNDARTCLVPFLDPEIYGRSVLENSSFIVSSVYPDSSRHGRGFVARLSGSTAEMISIWRLACAGPSPFVFDPFEPASGLQLRFRPSLPSWLIRSDGTFSFRFMGKCQITYHIGDPRDLFDTRESDIEHMILSLKDRRRVRIEGGFIGQEYALAVRRQEIIGIDIIYRSMT